LELKGLAYEYVPVHLVRGGGEQHTVAHDARNPFHELPVLTTAAGAHLRQSVAIVEYLEELHPAPALLPRDPVARAQIRAIVEAVNSGIHPIQNLKVLQQIELDFGATSEAKVAWARQWIARGFEALERVISPVAGAHAFGDAVTLADCFIIPQVYNAHRFGVAMEAYPTIARVTASAAVLEAFVRAHPDVQPDAA